MGESLLTLASQAGQMVVDAAATDSWETAEHRYAKMLGRGDVKQTQLAELWLEDTREQLEDTREQLAGGAGVDMEVIRTALAGRWARRWADLLEEDPDAEAELRGFIQEIQTAPSAEELSASDHAVFADDDVSSYAACPDHPGALAMRSELAYSAGQAGDAARCRELGISAYLVKPIRQRELLEGICNVLNLSSQKQAPLGWSVVKKTCHGFLMSKSSSRPTAHWTALTRLLPL